MSSEGTAEQGNHQKCWETEGKRTKCAPVWARSDFTEEWATELGCCGCRGLASEVMMIYCFASFDNWQMEKTRCRAREGGKFLSIRTPLTFTTTQRMPHPGLLSAGVMCWLWAALQRLWRHKERQPGPFRVPDPSSCVPEWPVLAWRGSPGSSAVSAWEQNAGESSTPFEKPHRTEQCRGNSSKCNFLG